MSRHYRLYDESGYLHVVLRGNNQQLIFLDDMDRRKFLKTLNEYCLEMNVDILAYCFMDNHIHLIIHDDNLKFSELMKKIEVAYVMYFNIKYERCGHLFQNRFYCKSISTDSYLLSAVRYVHCNPSEANICCFDQYKWSSYNEYLTGHKFCNTEIVLGIIGGIPQFVDFHKINNDYEFNTQKKSFKDSEAKAIISEITGNDNPSYICKLSKESRNELLSKMKSRGLSIRQISRLTGITKGVIQRA